MLVSGPGRITSRETRIEQPMPIGIGRGTPDQLVLLPPRARALGEFAGPFARRKVAVVPFSGQSWSVSVAGPPQAAPLPHPVPKLEIPPDGQGEIVSGKLHEPPGNAFTTTV